MRLAEETSVEIIDRKKLSPYGIQILRTEKGNVVLYSTLLYPKLSSTPPCLLQLPECLA